eukprot:9491786-Pyramimonas_sp.AAC.1
MVVMMMKFRLASLGEISSASAVGTSLTPQALSEGSFRRVLWKNQPIALASLGTPGSVTRRLGPDRSGEPGGPPAAPMAARCASRAEHCRPMAGRAAIGRG